MRARLGTIAVLAALAFGVVNGAWAFELRFSNLPKTENVTFARANSEIIFEVFGQLPVVLIGAANIQAEAVNGPTVIALPVTDVDMAETPTGVTQYFSIDASELCDTPGTSYVLTTQVITNNVLASSTRLVTCTTNPAGCTGPPVCQQFGDQQPDCSYAPVVPVPAYAFCTGPLILVDRTHDNFHQITPESSQNPGRYWGFAKLLFTDGYEVQDSTTPIGQLGTSGARVFVIANPRNALTAAEVTQLVSWVEGGGRLFLIFDHPPFAPVSNLLQAMGLDLSTLSSASQHTFFRSDATLSGTSPVTNATGGSTIIDEVETFTGTAFEPFGSQPPTAGPFDPVLIFPPGVTAFNGDDLSGDWQGLAFTLGDGRVYINGEAGGLTAQTPFGMHFTPQNEQYLLNVVHWLDSLLAP